MFKHVYSGKPKTNCLFKIEGNNGTVSLRVKQCIQLCFVNASYESNQILQAK